MAYGDTYDYTKSDESFAVPYGDNTAEIDDYTIADNTAPEKTAEQITKENVFSDIPVGDHLLILHSIPEAPKTSFYKVYVDGTLASFQSAAVRVRFCLPDNPKSQIGDYFVLPPDDPAEMQAYWEGVPAGKKMKGFNANKFYQFIGALGFPYPAGGKLPQEARRLGNWKGRTVMATVVAGSPYEEKVDGVGTGVMKPGNNQVKLFSYRPSEDTVSGRAGQGNHGNGSAHGNGQAASASQERRAASPAPVAVGAAGLDL